MVFKKQIAMGLTAIAVGLTSNFAQAAEEVQLKPAYGPAVIDVPGLNRTRAPISATTSKAAEQPVASPEMNNSLPVEKRAVLPESKSVNDSATIKLKQASKVAKADSKCKGPIDVMSFSNPPKDKFGKDKKLKDCGSLEAYKSKVAVLMSSNYGRTWENNSYTVGPIANPLFTSTGKTFASDVANRYKNSSFDKILVYKLSEGKEDPRNSQSNSISGNRSIVISDYVITRTNADGLQVNPSVSLKSHYTNIKGNGVAVLDGTRWPTIVSGNKIKDITGIDEEDGKYKVSKHEGEVNGNWLVLSALKGAFNGSIGENTLSSYVFAEDISKNATLKSTSEIIRSSNLEGLISNESCLNKEVCMTMTPYEFVVAAGNMAAYEITAKIIASKNEALNPSNLLKEDSMAKFSKELTGYLFPVNLMIGNSSGWTGYDANEQFVVKQNEVFTRCAPETNITSRFNLGTLFSQKEEKKSSSFNPNEVFKCIYDGTKQVIYNGGALK